MFENLYRTLEQYGFTHPLHPALTHLPIGLIVGGGIFALISIVFRIKSLVATAKHCQVLGFFMMLPTVVLGYSDWQHYYNGAWLFEIKMKFLLTGLLVLFSLMNIIFNRNSQAEKVNHLPLYLLCMLIVAGIGYYGGELHFAKNKAGLGKGYIASANKGSVRHGEQLFLQRCAFCHYVDKVDSKVGPGFKDLFKNEKLPASNRAVSREAIKQQFQTPFKAMPVFDQFPEAQINSLIDYLETL